MRITDLENFALQLAPELEDTGERVYVFDHPPDVIMPSFSRGYATRFSPLLDDCLVTAGEFDGPGRHIVFCEPASDEIRLPVLLHELAHCLPHTPRPVMPSREFAEAEFKAFAIAPDAPAKAWSPPWDNDHGIQFIRAALHLWWRSALAGRFCYYQDVVNCHTYGLGPTIFYWLALGSEPVVMRDATFTEIFATDPPELFNELFIGDVRRWIKNNPQAKKDYERCMITDGPTRE